MSVKIRKVVNNRKGSKTQGKVYGRAVVSDTINTKKLCQNIRDRCTLTEPDVVAVVSALITEVSGQLALGNRAGWFRFVQSGPQFYACRQCQEVYECQHQVLACYLPACHRDDQRQACKDLAQGGEGRGTC